MEDYIIVFVTAASIEDGEKIGNALVEEKLAACTNIIKGLTSIYTWKKKLCKDEEVLLLIKTRIEKFDKLAKRVKELHSYDVPEIIALPIVNGSKDYLNWVDESLS